MPNVLSPRDLVFRPDNMDETVPHTQIWTLKICNHDISKTITARSFKLGQLIENDE